MYATYLGGLGEAEKGAITGRETGEGRVNRKRWERWPARSGGVTTGEVAAEAETSVGDFYLLGMS